MIPAEVMKRLRRLKLDDEQFDAVAELLEQVEQATMEVAPPKKTARQERNARYYQNRRERLNTSEQDDSKTIKTVSDACDDGTGLARVRVIRDLPSGDISNISPLDPPKSQPARRKATRLTADWVLPPEFREHARSVGLSEREIDRQADRMRNWSLSAKGGAKLDWLATWRNWISDAPRGPPGRQTERTTILSSLFTDPHDDHEPPAEPHGPSAGYDDRTDGPDPRDRGYDRGFEFGDGAFGGRETLGDPGVEIIPPRRAWGS